MFPHMLVTFRPNFQSDSVGAEIRTLLNKSLVNLDFTVEAVNDLLGSLSHNPASEMLSC